MSAKNLRQYKEYMVGMARNINKANASVVQGGFQCTKFGKTNIGSVSIWSF